MNSEVLGVQKGTSLGAPSLPFALGPPVVPFYPFLGEGSPTKIDYRKRVPLFCPLYWRTLFLRVLVSFSPFNFERTNLSQLDTCSNSSPGDLSTLLGVGFPSPPNPDPGGGGDGGWGWRQWIR